MQEVYAIVGKRIRELRKRMKLTQEQLAEECGLDFRSIGAVERGERNLSLKSLTKIAKALNVTSEFLIHEEEPLSTEEKKLLIQEFVYTLEKENIDKIRYIVKDAKNFLDYEKQKRKKRKKKTLIKSAILLKTQKIFWIMRSKKEKREKEAHAKCQNIKRKKIRTLNV